MHEAASKGERRQAEAADLPSAASGDPDAGRRRVTIEGVGPELDGGRFPIKRTVGQRVVVRADIFADGHDRVRCVLKYRPDHDSQWTEVAMEPSGGDGWEGQFVITELVPYWYTLEAWIDRFGTWHRDLHKRVEAEQDVAGELLIGAELVARAACRAEGNDHEQLAHWAKILQDAENPDRVDLALGEPLSQAMARYPDRRLRTQYGKELEVMVDRQRAGFSAWYELFPRSCSPDPTRHGTFRDCEPWIRRIAQMGFDVLYLPPIHPIGRLFRKGPNNSVASSPSDPGSPWAIGSDEGGHKSIHPGLGTMADFHWLVDVARQNGVEIALDIAFQCAPDHPYVREHPEWFRRRPDGTIQYAENPPKKYQDIYPFDFETDHWQSLWEELQSIVLFWAEQGVRTFRVDNPHTKPFPFWEWLIRGVKRIYPETIFLAEAFTRPGPKYHLAKAGFTQSYTYFTWRNTRHELTEYLTQLMHTPVREYCRPNFWPNTPDILPEYLQFGGRPAFIARLVLAATLSGNYGVYGPPFERYQADPSESGSEEYQDSEKYQIRHWDPGTPGKLDALMRRINQIRRDNPALHHDWSVQFQPVDNDQILAFTKHSDDRDNMLLVVVNLDPYHKHSGWLQLPLEELGLSAERPYQMHDLLGDGRYLWNGPSNYVELDPQIAPAQIFRIRRQVRTERQFEYFM